MILNLVSILFACTSARHLGLTEEAERLFGFRCKILECAKCLTFWTTLIYMVAYSGKCVCISAAVAFLNAWLAMWLELCMGRLDTLYDKVYEKIYSTTADDYQASAGDEGGTGNGMPDLREEGGSVSENKT